jgi:tetratricopeptide (TPR) repeat protein
MQTKPVTLRIFKAASVCMLLVCGPLTARAQTPVLAPTTIILFDSAGSYDDDVPRAVVQTRDALRNDSRLEVLLYSPSSPSFILAARSVTPPIALDNMTLAVNQNAITTTVGGKYYVILTPDAKGKKLSAQIVLAGNGKSEDISKSESPSDCASDIESMIFSPVSFGSSASQPGNAVIEKVVDRPEGQPVPLQLSPASATPSSSAPETQPTAPAVLTPPVTAPPVHPPSPAQPIVPFAGPTVAASPPLSMKATPGKAGVVISNLTVSVGDSSTSSQPDTPSGLTPAQIAAMPVISDGAPLPTSAATPQTLPQTSTTPSTPSAPLASPVPVAQPTVAPSAPANPPIVPFDGPSVASTLPQSMQATPGKAGVTISNLTVSVGDSNDALVPETPIGLTPAQIAAMPVISDGSAPLSGTASTSPTAAVQPVPSVDALDPAAASSVAEGDTAMHDSDALSAISFYNTAVSLAPRASTPRLKLAQAYLAAGMKDAALDEAKRALTIDPDSADIKAFIESQVGDSDVGDAVSLAEAQTQGDPSNPSAWIALGDADWNANAPDDALDAYKKAADVDPSAVLPQTRLAKLYAAKAEYKLSLTALQKSGAAGYPYAMKIVASRSESLIGDLDDETNNFTTGTDTREQFYDKLKTTDNQAAGLADFVSKIEPPSQYKVSYLHRELSTKLLAQTVAVWMDYAETNNDADKTQAASLEQYAETEMKTASVAEDVQSQIGQ